MGYSRIHQLQIDFLSAGKDGIVLEGGFWFPSGDADAEARIGMVELECRRADGRTEAIRPVMGYTVVKQVVVQRKKREMTCRFFRCAVPMSGGDTVSLWFRHADDGTRIPWREITHGVYSPMTERVGASYCHLGPWMARVRSGAFVVTPATRFGLISSELAFCLQLAMKCSFPAWRALVFRMIVGTARRFVKRPIWLVSDRPGKADDNGRAFFEYLCSLPRTEASPRYVFALDTRIPEAGELRKIGPVVNMRSRRYKVMLALADWVISAYHTRSQRMPFNLVTSAYLKPRCVRPRFVYLRHGISMNDVSGMVGRSFDNARIMISSARREYRSVLEGAYGYTDREVKLCGLARYDKLYDDPRKLVTFMPTWRRTLVSRNDRGDFKLLKGFQSSRFYLFYCELLNHPDLIRACEECGYALQLMIHPNLAKALPKFSGLKHVRLLSPHESYRRLFAETSLLVTDYSSVAFDFAYLRKPVVYCQFDRDEFFGDQYREGYYDYERDGFGEVETSVDAAAARIVEYIRGGCRMKDAYADRVGGFFAYTDRDNRKRIHKEILKAIEEDGPVG